MTRKPRPKKCKACGETFQPRQSFASACSPKCAMALTHRAAERSRARERSLARARTRADKLALMTTGDWKKRAQTAFNAYIRERDKHKPCICCGKPLTLDAIGGGYDCGHYRSTGSAPHLRFHPDNAHAQRKVCNRHGAGRAVDYRLGLIKRIGLSAVEALEADQEPRKYTIEDLQGIEREFKAKLRELRKAA